MADDIVRYYAVSRAETTGLVDDSGWSSICVAVFSDMDEAIAEASHYLREGYSVSIDIGTMTDAEWDALEEVPDDFTFERANAEGR